MARATGKETGRETAVSEKERLQGIAVEMDRRAEAGQASVYSAGELAANAGTIFGTRQECVAAALKAVNKSCFTIAEAKGIVETFLKREVR